MSPFSDAQYHSIMLFPYSLKSLPKTFPRNFLRERRGAYKVLFEKIGIRLIEDIGMHEGLQNGSFSHRLAGCLIHMAQDWEKWWPLANTLMGSLVA